MSSFTKSHRKVIEGVGQEGGGGGGEQDGKESEEFTTGRDFVASGIRGGGKEDAVMGA